MEGGKKKKNAKFSGHYVRQRTHNVRAHTLRSDQLNRSWTQRKNTSTALLLLWLLYNWIYSSLNIFIEWNLEIPLRGIEPRTSGVTRSISSSKTTQPDWIFNHISNIKSQPISNWILVKASKNQHQSIANLVKLPWLIFI